MGGAGGRRLRPRAFGRYAPAQARPADQLTRSRLSPGKRKARAACRQGRVGQPLEVAPLRRLTPAICRDTLRHQPSSRPSIRICRSRACTQPHRPLALSRLESTPLARRRVRALHERSSRRHSCPAARSPARAGSSTQRSSGHQCRARCLTAPARQARPHSSERRTRGTWTRLQASVPRSVREPTGRARHETVQSGCNAQSPVDKMAPAATDAGSFVATI